MANNNNMSDHLARDDEDTVRSTLESLIHSSGEGYAALSRVIGRNPAYIQQYLKRKIPKKLTEEDRRRLAFHFGVSEVLLGAPAFSSDRIFPANTHTEDCLQLSWLGHSQQGRSSLQIDSAFLEGIRPSSSQHLAAYTVVGDSMAPTLSHGDHVLIDTSECKAFRDGIYALKNDALIILKRLSVNPATSLVTILSDNTAYASFADCDPRHIQAIGRVIWMGRKLG